MFDLRAGSRPATPAGIAVAASLGCAAACWVVALSLMRGMDSGPATELGSFPFFAPLWMSMMAAMMLPGAVPAGRRIARASGLQAAGRFLASCLAAWALVGGVVYVTYRPHGDSAAAAVVIAAGLYELTPWKRRSRERCRASAGSGLEFGVRCVGSSIGLMTVLIAVGVMNMAWMAVVTVVVLAQKVLQPRATVDVPLALAIVALGVLIAVAPSAVPGLTASM